MSGGPGGIIELHEQGPHGVFVRLEGAAGVHQSPTGFRLWSKVHLREPVARVKRAWIFGIAHLRGVLYEGGMDARSPPGDHTLQARETEAVTIIGGSARTGVVVLCDHASNQLPPRYGTLGLPVAELSRHIAYDIGAEVVTRGIAATLGAPAVLSRFSRLLIDPNRGIDDPTLIMRLSDGAIIPGNRHLDAAERDERITRYYTPYHAAVTAVLDECMASGTVPVIVSIHSFTPVWKGTQRSWHAAILWDKDPRLAMPLLGALRQDQSLVVGDNEPYSGVLQGDTLWQHGTCRGLAHAIVEIRQDLIATPEGQAAWAERLAAIVAGFRAEPLVSAALHRLEVFGSHTDICPTNPDRGTP